MSGCSNSTESTESAGKPNFTGATPSTSSAASSATETETDAEEDSADGSADDTEAEGGAGRGRDAEAGGENKMVLLQSWGSRKSDVK